MIPLVSDSTVQWIVWVPIGAAVGVLAVSMIREHCKDRRDDSG